MIGKTFSHYHVLQEIGRGGMGIVYAAEDTKLKRTVALKFLPKQLSIHGEERERFTLEAQAVSALNHPNICTVYEIDETDGESFIAMEYIDGITLREWISRKSSQPEGYRKLGLREAVGIATQIAEGLAAAHERGIIHRDIKSENIMVTSDGRAKVMDFGLAKLRGTSKLTKTGSTVGTIAYMSPEQVEGMETDHRTDIFSFGVVLYEMIAGVLPFRAEHETAVMYEIINVEPKPPSQLRAGIEDDLNHIVLKCLEKERDVRYQSMKDVAVDLKRYQRTSEGKRIEKKILQSQSGPLETPAAPAARPLPRWMIPAAILLIAGIAVAGYLVMSRTGPPKPISRLVKLTSSPGLEYECALSPDGKFAAYTTDERGKLDIVIQPLGGGKLIRLTEADSLNDDAQPAWSPDGSRIAFVSARDHGGRLSIPLGMGLVGDFLSGQNGDIFVVPSTGGTPLKLVQGGYYPSWSPDGKTIVYQSSTRGHWSIWTIPSQGGEPKQVTNDSVNNDQARYSPENNFQAHYSPDGNWILYASSPSGLFVIPAGGGEPTRLLGGSAIILSPAWSGDGKAVFYASNASNMINIWRLPMGTLPKTAGAPAQVTIGEGSDVSPSIIDSTMIYASLTVIPAIWELDVATGKLRKVSISTMGEDYPQLSPDGKSILVTSDDGENSRLRLIGLDGTPLAELTPQNKQAQFGCWSPDGTEIAYSSSEGIFIQRRGDLSTQVVHSGPSGLPDWSPDGKFLAFNAAGDSGRSEIDLYDIAKGTTTRLAGTSAATQMPTWSLDGKQIFYNINRGTYRQVAFSAVDHPSERIITGPEAEYSHPRGSPKDPDMILCLRNHKNACLLSISTGAIREITHFVDANTLLDYPSWSGDGSKVYFSLTKKTGDILLMRGF